MLTLEPLGLVGLDTMAVKGIACIGNTGEDYAIPGYNAIVMESDDRANSSACMPR